MYNSPMSSWSSDFKPADTRTIHPNYAKGDWTGPKTTTKKNDRRIYP
jgi:hypothetical protein